MKKQRIIVNLFVICSFFLLLNFVSAAEEPIAYDNSTDYIASPMMVSADSVGEITIHADDMNNALDIKNGLSIKSDVIRPSGQTIYITQDNYEDYFYKFTGEIREDADILPGDILRIGNISERGFVIDRQLTLAPISENDEISNGFVHLIAGSNGSTVTGLTINNTVGPLYINGIYVGQLHGIWLTNSSYNTISYNTIRIANAPGCYAMPMGWSSYNRIVYNDMKTYITCNIVMGSCHYNDISYNMLEVLSYSTGSVTNLIYFNPFGHADYGGPATCYGTIISNNYLKGFCTGEMSIILQLLGGSDGTRVINNTVIKGSIGISLSANNIEISGNTVDGSLTSISASGNNVTVVDNHIIGDQQGIGIMVSGEESTVAPIVANNTIDYTNLNVGISVTGYVNVYGNEVNLANYGTGISASGNGSYIHNNYINTLSDQGIFFLGSNITIDSNVITTKSDGIKISSESTVNRYYDNVISNNRIISDKYGVYISGLIYRTSIYGNIIETNATVGIYKYITDEASDDSADNMVNGVIYDATALVIDDDNFYMYFDKDGYLNYTFKENRSKTIFFTFLTDKNVFFEDKITVISNKMSNLLFNVTISFSGNSSGSTIRDFNFYNFDKSGIILENVSDVSVTNNNFTMIFKNNIANASAIFVKGNCDNSIISDNNMYLNSRNNLSYGIVFINSKGNSSNVEVNNNNIIMIAQDNAQAIYIESLIESDIQGNNINIISEGSAWGIVAEGSNQYLNVSNNEVIIHGSKDTYLISLNNLVNGTLENNYLYSEADTVFGIYGFNLANLTVVSNEFILFSTENTDSNVIFISNSINNTNITENIIYSNAIQPINIDNLENNVTIIPNSYVVDNSNFDVFFNVHTMLNEDIISSGDVILLNNLTGKSLTITVPVNVSSYKNLDVVVALKFLKKSAGTNISGLSFINSTIELSYVNNVTVFNNSFADNVIIDIVRSENSLVFNNTFDVYGLSSSIVILDNAINTEIYNNLFNVNVSDSAEIISLIKSQNTLIYNNNMTGFADSLYFINSDNSRYSSVVNNTIRGNASTIFGYYGSNSHYDRIEYNDMIIYGTAAVTNQAGVYYGECSSSNNILSNNIISYSLNDDDYAVIINSTEFLFNSVLLNYLISGNGSKRADYAVFALFDVVGNNTPFYIYVSPDGDDTTGDGSESHPYGSIEVALEKALNYCIIYLLDGVYTESDLVIDKNVTITANSLNGDVFINANGNQLFNITDTGALTVNAIKIFNAHNVLGGAAFINNGYLVINNSILFNCSSYYNNSNPVFIRQEVSSQGLISYYTENFNKTGLGGVILNNGNLFVNSSSFMNNFAHKGGVLADFGESVIESSIFTNNSGVHGGVIYSNFDSNLTIGKNCVFIDNVAVSALDFCGLRGYVSSSSIIYGDVYSYYSLCSLYDGESIGGGGVIFTNANVRIEDSYFVNNTATYGGVIAHKWIDREYSNEKPKGIFEIDGCYFSGNYAEDTKAGNASLLGSYVYNSGYNGGVIYGYFDQLIIENSNFTDNVALGEGGAIKAGAVNGIITYSIFTGNTAGSQGGALSLSGNFLITHTIISNNSATYGGGVKYDSYTSYGHIQDHLDIVNATISGNTALEGGGAFYMGESNMTVSYSNIYGNTAPSQSTIYYFGSPKDGNLEKNYWGEGKGPDDSVWNSGLPFKDYLDKPAIVFPPIDPIDPNPDNPGTGDDDGPSDDPITSIIDGTGPSISTDITVTGGGSGSGNQGSGQGGGHGSGDHGSGDGADGDGTGDGDNPSGTGNSTGDFSNSTSNPGSNGTDGVVDGIANGTVITDSVSRVNGTDNNLASVGMTANAIAAASEGSGSGNPSDSSSSASNSEAYEISKKVDKEIIDNSNSIIVSVILIIILCILFVIGYKSKKNNDDEY